MSRSKSLSSFVLTGITCLSACSSNDSADPAASESGNDVASTSDSGTTGGTTAGGTTSSMATSTSAGTNTSSGAGGANSTVATSVSGGGASSSVTSSSTDGGTAGSGASTSIPSSADRPSTDTTWSDGLGVGANGPIPFIVVDQFGYRTRATKVAVIRDPQTGYDSGEDFTPGSTYAVVDKATGTTIKEGAPAAWNGGSTDASSGDKVWWFDFSDVTTPGTYTVVDLDNDKRSMEFEIDDNIYVAPLKHAVRSYYYQRAGFAKSADTVGDEWADGASHLGAGQDSEAHAWTAKTDESLVRDLRGGWYDAGDFNKYTAWAAGTAIALLRAYDEHPSAFGDDYGIAESGNGVPDLLDEVKWAIDWLVRMQNSDGSLLCILGLASASPPSAATEPSYYGPATTNATWMGAAAFAYASKIFGARPEADLKEYATDLASRAIEAWNWATENPSVAYFNNDESKQAGSSGLGAGQQEVDDAGRLFSKFQAAVYLYEQTGEATYRDFVEANYGSIVPSWGPTQWDMEKQDVVLYYAKLGGTDASVASNIVNQFVESVTSHEDQWPLVDGEQDPYRAPLQDYQWGSNQIKMAQARLYQLLAAHGSDELAESASAAAEDYVHYLHGVNPLGLVYLTNMQRAGAEHSARTMYHTWFADQTQWDEVSNDTPGPAPGFLVGGPNLSFSLDSCCTAPAGDDAYQCYGATEFSLCNDDWEPPLGQPVQKAFLQFNSGWPAGSWSITEPSTGYEAKYVLVLAAYTR